MAENGLCGPVIGVAFDGTGYGTDGQIWGGEFLEADFSGFERRAHFRYIPLPGGDAAIRQPWRSALSYLRDAFGADIPDGLPAMNAIPDERIYSCGCDAAAKVQRRSDLFLWKTVRRSRIASRIAPACHL